MAATPQIPFKLKPETLAELDLIVTHLAKTTGLDCTRSDAVRYAIRKTAESIAGKEVKKTQKNPK